jgi:hypothetical protein
MAWVAMEFPVGHTAVWKRLALATGGDININTGSLSITNGAEGTVSNLGTDNAGNLVVRANSINLDNSGKHPAESVTGRGGKHSSNDNRLTAVYVAIVLISALSGTSGSNGIDGNIKYRYKVFKAVQRKIVDIVAMALGVPLGVIFKSMRKHFRTQFRQHKLQKVILSLVEQSN